MRTPVPPLPACSNLIVFDEVMQHLDGEGCLRVAQLLKQVSDGFGIVVVVGCCSSIARRCSVSAALGPNAVATSSHPPTERSVPLSPARPPPRHRRRRLPQLPHTSVLVVAQAHSLAAQAFDATDLVVKSVGQSRVQQGSTVAVS